MYFAIRCVLEGNVLMKAGRYALRRGALPVECPTSQLRRWGLMLYGVRRL